MKKVVQDLTSGGLLGVWGKWVKHAKYILNVLWLSNFIRSKGYPLVLEMAKAEKERVDAGGERRFHFDFAGKFFEESEREYFESYMCQWEF